MIVTVRWSGVASASPGLLVAAFLGKLNGSCIGSGCSSSKQGLSIGGGVEIPEGGFNVFPNNIAVSLGTSDALYCSGQAQLSTVPITDPNCAAVSEISFFDWYVGSSNTPVATTRGNSTVVNFNGNVTQSIGVRYRYRNNTNSPIYRSTFIARPTGIVGPSQVEVNSRDGLYELTPRLGVSSTGRFTVVPNSNVSIDGLGYRSLITFTTPGTYTLRYSAIQCGTSKTWTKTVVAVRSNNCTRCRSSVNSPSSPRHLDKSSDAIPIRSYPTVINHDTRYVNIEGINYLGDMREYHVVLVSVLGRKIFQLPLASKIDIGSSELQSGIYSLSVQSSDGNVLYSTKLVIR